MIGARDPQTVVAGGRRSASPRISGVRMVDLGNVMTRSGWMAEVFRTDWSPAGSITADERDAVLSSWSWRVTAPLRTLSWAVRRLAGGLRQGPP